MKCDDILSDDFIKSICYIKIWCSTSCICFFDTYRVRSLAMFHLLNKQHQTLTVFANMVDFPTLLFNLRGLNHGGSVVNNLKKIAMNPWGFTLYESDKGTVVIKVMFTEGDYKVDVGRFFVLDSKVSELDIEYLKAISKKIRENYQDYKVIEVLKSDLLTL
ncbi:hypothetical protein ABW12_24930 [Pluralibacter gergoviae]|nr:hypothetical protein ABW12_24930 [Pluralibacter gergoviae]